MMLVMSAPGLPHDAGRSADVTATAHEMFSGEVAAETLGNEGGRGERGAMKTLGRVPNGLATLGSRGSHERAIGRLRR
jgi:hypothetical protein